MDLKNILDFTILRKVIYISLGNLDRIMGRTNDAPIILCYHSFNKDKWRFSIDFNEFRSQIEYLRSKYSFISISDLELFLKGKKEIRKNSILLTIDDGYKNVLHAEKYLKKIGVEPVLFVLSNPSGVDRDEMDTNLPLLTIKEITRLKRSGWTIGCHSATHANLEKTPLKVLSTEIIESKKTLEKELDSKISYFAYPKGKYSQQVINSVIKANYNLAFSMDDDFISTSSKHYAIPRVGVDKTHGSSEFKHLFSPSVIKFRRIVKSSPLGVYL